MVGRDEQKRPSNLGRSIQLACDRFEEAWRNGKNPRLEEFLHECPPAERPRLLQSLQNLQQILILRQFDSVTSNAPSSPIRKASEAGLSQQPTYSAPKSAVAKDGSQSVTFRISLRVISGPHEGEEFHYEEHDTLLVGRSPQAQLQLKDDVHFSRYHFRLEFNPPTCFLMDLHSRNGTLVNGERVTEQFLKDGDAISGGRTKMVVSIQQIGAARAGSGHNQFHNPATPPAMTSVDRAGSPDEVTTVLPVMGAEGDGSQVPEIRIDGYQIHEQIGQGDHGTVYRATRIASGEPCALKVMSTEAVANEKSAQIFLREATLLRQLKHANIVRMIEMNASGTNMYLSTEYVNAIPWDKAVARMSVDQRIRVACGLMSQVLVALEYAHSLSMVHRDVKPANILICRQDGKLTAKLADFGLAKQYSNAGMSRVTRVGDVIGSLPYMPPEQFINSRDAKPACDIYSAGATLYWMLSGRDPILFDNHPCKFLAIIEDAPAPIQQYCAEIPDALARLVHRTLEKTPEKRFQSAAEMRQQLRRFVQPKAD